MSIRKEDINSKPLENGTPNSSSLLGRSNATASPIRLPSFKPPRDLTLGLPKATLSLSAKPRKKFTPNIPSRRDKCNDITDSKPGDDNSRQGNRGRRGKWENRGRGGGGGPSRKNKPVFIQTAGSVFGEGIGEATKRYHHNNDYAHSREVSGSSVTKTTLNLERQQNVDKKAEDLKLQSLLSCDFLDDPHSAPDETFRPISLPLLHERKILKKEGREDKVKTEGIKTEDDDNKGIVKIKTEAGWDASADSNCLDTKVQVKEEPESGDEAELKVKPKAVMAMALPPKGPNECSVMELLDSSKKGYLLFQLPTCLPGPAPEVVAEVSGKPGKAPLSVASSTEVQNSVGTLEEVSEQLEECSLNSLPEGHLGTIRVHESGKAVVILNGGYSLVVNPGTQVGFLQELVSVDLDETRSSGRMLVLGQVCSTLNCTPDLETMILSDGWNS